MSKITAIELKNFQTVSDRKLIPIRDLTLLFGPNSAGKSAILDCLTFISQLCSDKWDNIEDMLTRWARKKEGKYIEAAVGMGIQFEVDRKWEFHNSFSSPEKSPLKISNFYNYHSEAYFLPEIQGSNLEFYIDFYEVDESWYFNSIKISINSNEIIDVNLDIYGQNNDSIKIYKRDWINTELFANLINKKSRYVKEELDYYHIEFHGANINNQINERMVWISTYDHEDLVDILNFLQQGLNLFTWMINESFENKFKKISGNRIPPNKDESLYISHGSPIFEPEYSGGEILPKEFWPILFHLNDSDRKKADSWTWNVLSYWIANHKSKVADSEKLLNWKELDEFDKLNQLLREELFEESGYQVDADVRILLPIEDLDNFLSQDDSHKYSKLIKIFLRDNNLNKHEIEDVGSGIGYVLPVLVALIDKGNTFIQQPEIHLHPAMQSQLGEIIFKTSESKIGNNSCTIIETHSENLLLRILKILRIGNNNKLIADKKLDFENISILYFDPKIDGTTSIKRLRLAPDGTFVDRWPRGFFTEKYGDLFDE